MVTYYRQPAKDGIAGKIDEQVTFSKKVKDIDLQTTNVILDYKKRAVVKCVIESSVVPTTFEQLHAYYSEVYPSLISQIEQVQAAEAEKSR